MNSFVASWSSRLFARACRAGTALLLTTLALRAQLQWSVFNESATTAAPVATATSGVTVTVPAGQRVTLVANNFVPFDLSAAGSEQVAAISFKVSGGLSTIAAGTRAVGFGLYNNGGTATNYADDSGYFTWLNGRNTGSLIEQRRRIGDGTSPSLLNPTGTAFNNLSTGQASLTPGSLSDGNIYQIQFRLQGRSGSIAFGNTSSNTTGAGIWVSGPGISTTTFSNPDAPAATFTFNEVGFMFLNTTSSPVTLTIVGVTGLTPINPPAIAVQPAALSFNPGQQARLDVTATGTPPLTYQWRKDGTNISGATNATYLINSVAATDAGSYSVVVTNAYGTVTSSAGAVTVTSANIPATIARQPAPVTVAVGETASFSVTAFGSPPLSYQWQKDGVAVPGLTGSLVGLGQIKATDAGNYTVVVTSGSGATATTATSTPVALSVNIPPAITTQPASVLASLGQNVTLSVAATGSPTPSYQWSRNGVPIAGATSASLALSNITIANAGSYTVAIVNDAGAVTSAAAVLAIPSAMAVTNLSPVNGATSINTDTPLSITFDRPPTRGTSGRLRIYRASDDALVETIDLGASLQQRTVGTNGTMYNFLPVIVTGNTAAIYPHAGVLAYGQTYYVNAELSTFLDATGASFTGITDKTTWRFSTKASGPAANATALTVAANGSGDFSTVQGAIDAVPAGNAQRVVITVKKGNYTELVYIGATRPLITVRGEDRAQTIVGYPNNNNLNGTTATRAAFSIAGNDSILENITILNPTPQGGSQAEAVFTGAQRVMLNRVNLLSRQDTLLTNTGTAFITDSYIEGNVDFMWGTAAAYYQRCELKALDVGTATVGFYTQVRNGATGFGNVYVDCRLTAADGVVGKVQYFLGRVDPGPGNFPYSQCMYLNCAMGAHIDPAGWRLDNATSSPTVQYFEYKSTDLSGATLDVTKRHVSSRQLSETEANFWRNPANVLGGWNPSVAPTIETSPASTSAVAGTTAQLSVLANGAPPPAIQWFKDGVAIAGATDATLILPNVSTTAAGNYYATATGGGTVVTSAVAALTVNRGAYAGTYFGTLGTGGGTFALYVRDNGSAVFLGTISGSTSTAVVARSATVDAGGRLRASGTATIDGTITGGGAVAGTASVGSGASAAAGSFSGSRSTSGASQAFAGFYQVGTNSASTTASLIVGGSGQAFALSQNGLVLDAGTGTVDANGVVSVRTAGGTNVAATLSATGTTTTTLSPPSSGTALTLTGGNDAGDAQRMREFSSRARVDATAPAFAGFVLTGAAPTQVLIRAVGPILADSFAVAGALPNPRLDVYRGGALFASNVNWTTALNANDAASAATRVGAFPLRATLADSALSLTLPAGAYSAVMSSANGATAGIGLLEVYDVTGGAAGQRLVNVSARGIAGTGANVVIAGFYVGGTQPKRVLVRGVGPGLAAYGVTGALAKPVLSVFRGGTQIAQNTNWTSGADVPNLVSAALEAGAFPLTAGTGDAALLLNLAPGVYSAQVASGDTTTGVALVEVYELP